MSATRKKQANRRTNISQKKDQIPNKHWQRRSTKNWMQKQLSSVGLCEIKFSIHFSFRLSANSCNRSNAIFSLFLLLLFFNSIHIYVVYINVFSERKKNCIAYNARIGGWLIYSIIWMLMKNMKVLKEM